MADWQGMSRSNYLHVRDEAAFRCWAQENELCVINDSQGRVGFYSDTDDGGFPTSRVAERQDGWEEVDIVAELADHLRDGEIAVLVSVGHEKARYATGYAIALNHEGSSVRIEIGDIYERAAAAFGIDVGSISEAAY